MNGYGVHNYRVQAVQVLVYTQYDGINSESNIIHAIFS